MRKNEYSSHRTSTVPTRVLLVIIWIVIAALVVSIGWMFVQKAQSLGGEQEAKSGEGDFCKTAFITVYDATYDEIPPVFMLLRFDSHKGVITAAALPADLSIAAEPKTMTLSEHFAYGGVTGAARAAEDLLGIKTDYYAAFDSSVLSDVADIMGEVEFDVPEDMITKNKNGALICDIKKGKQSLAGQQFTEFFRFGGWDANTRADMAAKFTCALIDAYSPEQNSSKISELFGEVASELDTDVSIIEISDLELSYAKFRVNKQTADRIAVTSTGGAISDSALKELQQVF